MDNELAVQSGREMATDSRVLTVINAMEELKLIRTFVANELREGIDFGLIPGTNKKSLWLPGAQKTAMFYNCSSEFDFTGTELGDGHIEYVVKCRLVSRSSGVVASSGLGSCSSMEKKYRFRGESRKCPKCGADAIMKGAKEYGGGFYCNRKKGGCNAKFRDDDRSITGQNAEQNENPDIWDIRNTILKMAKKRALVDASMALGCMSELFTQDIGDVFDLTAHEVEVEAIHSPPPKPQNNSGHGSGMYGSPEQVEAYRRATIEFCDEQNARWADQWMNRVTGTLAEGIADIVNPHQMTNHLLKWALKEGKLAPVGMTFDPETGKPVEKVSSDQAKKFVAVVFAREPEALHEEAEEYAKEQAELARERWFEKYGQTQAQGE